MNSTSFKQNCTNFWVSIDDFQLLIVSGPEAAKFLQGQVTCDVRELEGGTTRIGAQCNPKGRVLLSFRALQMNQNTIALRIPAPMYEKAVINLGKYIVFSKATLVNGADEFLLVGLYGPDADQLAKGLFFDLPEEIDRFVERSGNFLIKLAPNRYECWIKYSNKDEFIAQLSSQSTQSTTDAWKLQDIQAGIANIYPETYEVFTPQEINYQLVNAVHFRKGCYTGQEIVARLHYRGKLKRHMYRFEIATTEVPAVGTSVLDTADNQHVGTLITASQRDGAYAEALVSLIGEKHNTLILANSKQKLKQLPLPYAIPTADEKLE